MWHLPLMQAQEAITLHVQLKLLKKQMRRKEIQPLPMLQKLAKISMEPTPMPFKFRSLAELYERKTKYSPSSSPIPLPSEENFVISSDEELENLMLEMGNMIDNGM